MRKKLIILQEGYKECGSASLLSIIRYYKGNISINKLSELCKTTTRGTTFYNIKNAALEVGLNSKAFKVDDINLLSTISSPILCQINNNGLLHFVVIYKIKNSNVILMDPAKGEVIIDKWEFIEKWTGYIMIFEPKQKLINIKDNKYFNKLIYKTLFLNKRLIILLLIFSMIITISTCVISFYLQFIIDYIISNNYCNLFAITLIFALIYFLKNTGAYLKDNITSFLNEKIDITIITNAYTKLLLLPYNYYKSKTTGDIISRINDLMYIKNMINKIIITVLLDLLIAICGGLLLYNINKNLFSLLIIIIIIYVIIYLIFNPYIKKYIKIISEKNSLINSHLIETINSFETVKGIGIEKKLQSIFEQKYADFTQILYKYNKLISLETYIKSMFSSIIIILIMYLGTKYMKDGSISLSSFITFNYLLIYFLDPILNIINVSKELNYVKNTIMRINNLFEVDSINLDSHDKLELNGNIKINNLTFSYNGVDNVLKNINIDITNRDRVLILGSSGSGKSTFLKLLMKYYQVKRNMIFINNNDIEDISIGNIKSYFGYISQNEILYTMSIKENIILNRNISNKSFLDICNICQVNEIIKNTAMGYDYLVEEGGTNLSGGQKQRIVLARTLLSNKQVILIDEGLNQMDINLERSILKNIFSNYKDKTFIIISHRTENMDLYNKVISFNNGVVNNILKKENYNLNE